MLNEICHNHRPLGRPTVPPSANQSPSTTSLEGRSCWPGVCRYGSTARLIGIHGLTLVAAGVAIGLAAAFAATRIMEGVYLGVQPQDAATFASITALVLAVSAFACWLPAWRAARMAPMIALR